MGKLIEDIQNARAIHNGDLEFFDKIDWVDARGNPQLNFADQVMIHGKLIPMRDFFDASFSPLIPVTDRLRAILKINPLLNPEPMAEFLKEEQQKWEKERTTLTLDNILKLAGPILEEAVFGGPFLFNLARGLETFMSPVHEPEQKRISGRLTRFTLNKLTPPFLHPLQNETLPKEKGGKILRLMKRLRLQIPRPAPVKDKPLEIHPMHPNEVRCQK